MFKSNTKNSGFQYSPDNYKSETTEHTYAHAVVHSSWKVTAADWLLRESNPPLVSQLKSIPIQQ